jgi:hypothetical protein
VSTETVKLTSDAETKDGVRTADIEIGRDGSPDTARIHDRPGEHYPYRKGDRVRVQVVHDDPAAGIHIAGLYGENPEVLDEGNREIHSRPDSGDLRLKSPAGDVRIEPSDEGLVRLGSRPDEEQVALATQPATKADLLSLQQQIDSLISALNNATAGGNPVLPGIASPTGAWTVVIAAGAVPDYVPVPIQPIHDKADGGAGTEDVVARPEEVT